MKKFTLLFIAATLIACGAKDDDEDTSGRTTDPFIGTWQTSDGGEVVTIANNADGTSSMSYTDGIGGGYGTWRNASSNPNFNSYTQTYIFDEGTEDEASETLTFSSDFSSWTCPECTNWVRQ